MGAHKLRVMADSILLDIIARKTALSTIEPILTKDHHGFGNHFGSQTHTSISSEIHGIVAEWQYKSVEYRKSGSVALFGRVVGITTDIARVSL
jgi:hypothetical protein